MKKTKVVVFVIILTLFFMSITYFIKNNRKESKDNSAKLQILKSTGIDKVDTSNFKTEQYTKLKIDTKNNQNIKTSGWLNQLYASTDCNNIKLFPFPFLIQINEKILEFNPLERLETENTLFTKIDKSLKITLSAPVKTCSAKQDDFENSVITITTYTDTLNIYASKGIPFIKITTSSSLNIENKNTFLSIKKLENNSIIIFNNVLVSDENEIPTTFPTVKYNFAKEDSSYFQQILISPKSPFVLLPHQQKNSVTKYTSDKYFKSVKGDVFSVYVDSILINLPIINIPNVFDNIDTSNIEQLKTYFRNDIEELGREPFSDNLSSYWNGKKLFKVANLLIVSEKINDKSSEDFLKNVLKKELSDFYSYTGNTDTKYFIYYKNIGALQNSKPDYGHEFLNDTHFHFGYYIYASSILCKYDADFCSKYKTSINILIKSVASFSENSYFPFLRHLSLYEGHSFASGLTKSGDGNNQESSSESLNFWYSSYLFNKIIKSKDTEIYYLSYLLEAESTKIYYLNYYNSKLYDTSYKHKIFGIVWEGKNDFATWFSGNPKAIYGIQFIPISFASVYLQTPQYKDILTQLSNELSDTNKKENLFEDLILGYQILNEKIDPKNIEGLRNIDSSDSKSWLFYLNSSISR